MSEDVSTKESHDLNVIFSEEALRGAEKAVDSSQSKEAVVSAENLQVDAKAPSEGSEKPAPSPEDQPEKTKSPMTWVMYPIAKIKIDKRFRTVDRSKVAPLAESIKTLGMLTPIIITPEGKLVAALHRVEACKLLGMDEIPVTIRNYDRLRAELAEIDENLMRSELTELEKAECIHRRKQIYEQLFPQTKAGGDRKSQKVKSNRQDGDLKTQRFTADAAKTMGTPQKERFSVMQRSGLT
jgi:hypothetical protein